MSSTCLLTPVYARDVDRFMFLRESIEACGIDLPHVAVVHTEDMPLLGPLRHRRGLSLLATADVLPAWLERKRRAWGEPRWSPRRVLARWPLDGWTVQMFTKLLAPSYCGSAATVVCIDADMAFIRRVDDQDFVTGDRTHLYRFTDGLDTEMVEWVGRSMRFLGVNPCGKAPRKYTYSPLPMNIAVLRDMHGFVERRSGRHWLDAMLAEPWLTEYATYGCFAEHVDGLARVIPVTPTIAGWCWWPDDVSTLQSSIDAARCDPGVRIVGVQSNLRRDVASYADSIRACWT